MESWARFRSVFARGLASALHGRVLIPLYLCNLLLGLLQTWPLGLSIANGALHSSFLPQMLSGGGDALSQLFLGSTSAPWVAGAWGALLLPLAGVFGLAYCFFTGGVLQSWNQRDATNVAVPAPRSYWGACRRYFWPLVGQGLLLLIILGILLAISGAVGRVINVAVGAFLAVLFILLLDLIGMYGRALAVARDIRNPFRLIGGAFLFLLHHLPGIVVLLILGILLRAIVFGLGTLVSGVLGASPLVVIWQQLLLFALLWVKFLQLAWALHYFSLQGQPEAPVPNVVQPMQP